MPPLTGLTGLYPDPQDTTDVYDEGVLEAKANPLDPDHSEYGAQSLGYSGTVPSESPYGPMAVYDGYSREDTLAYGGMGYPVGGNALDDTPVTHASPYPRGIIQQSWDDVDALGRVGDQLNALHGPDLGGPRLFNGHAPSGHEEDTKWDFTNTHGEQDVPFWGRHPVEQMPLDGPDSPYFEQGSIEGGLVPWEGRIGDPTPYVQPAEPTIAQAVPTPDVWAWS
jgi:hypothetical protein